MEATNSMALHTLSLSIDGMTCASCVGRVEKALKKLTGVVEAEVNLATETARVMVTDAGMAGALIAAVDKAGYQARVMQTTVRLTCILRRRRSSSRCHSAAQCLAPGAGGCPQKWVRR